jgi:hypothetical protein
VNAIKDEGTKKVAIDKIMHYKDTALVLPLLDDAYAKCKGYHANIAKNNF